ncbi:MAG: undecaprenyldiphospho-muramoylpentapeptide beta-N-acetylglucosaminyltransferase [Bacteroidales bacterium]|jgi:UDP-N-acetylglucosamine--N-acetylmuramyl-(pentapeptide) pyrophosphoryl-undecaprenol N-acetylglucosamine transferase|nr:undecaprenyldiphospho-muramoylpentapeptide beta-N-acetylglucosaminyltransferase [Bacteroidaceae bacterium]MDO4200725.1 undecaprenyldiphospho-muramoylpentapeptide beta-N-acetylglucosaminyltransferase [Bacteroidales bacterium]
MEQNKPLRVIISGGGTGGHIFPAVSIANALKKQHPEAEILFVGALGRMEMQRVPAAGYKIEGLPVRGLYRPLWNPKNIGVMMDFLKSKKMVKKILQNFKPQVAVGVGGYASAPTLNAAYSMGIPCLIQEQNSYAGVTNKSLAKKAKVVCVAYSGMARFFPAEKILMTGNPVRQNLLDNKISKEDARESFGLAPDKKTVLIVGGSLGARTINESVLAHLEEIRKSDVQFIWQTGKYYSQHIAEELSKAEPVENLKVMDFISSMDNAYAAADIVVSRAGASSISELCLLGKPCILVPSPNVAEDHQTKNAMALSGRGAAILVKDKDAKDELIGVALKTVMDDLKLDSLSGNVKMMAFHNAADVIAEEVYKLAVEYKNKQN